jgi:protein scribble
MEIRFDKLPNEKLGIGIRGGASPGCRGNPLDKTDDGIFISKITSYGAVARTED